MLTKICIREGMGQKLIKNHLILHLSDYINYYGPPTGWDSGPSEQHHKESVKVPARLTRRQQESFNEEVGKWYCEAAIIQKAETHYQLSKAYLNQPNQGSQFPQLKDAKVQMFGACFFVGLDQNMVPGLQEESKKHYD